MFLSKNRHNTCDIFYPFPILPLIIHISPSLHSLCPWESPLYLHLPFPSQLSLTTVLPTGNDGVVRPSWPSFAPNRPRRACREPATGRQEWGWAESVIPALLSHVQPNMIFRETQRGSAWPLASVCYYPTPFPSSWLWLQTCITW